MKKINTTFKAAIFLFLLIFVFLGQLFVEIVKRNAPDMEAQSLFILTHRESYTI